MNLEALSYTEKLLHTLDQFEMEGCRVSWAEWHDAMCWRFELLRQPGRLPFAWVAQASAGYAWGRSPGEALKAVRGQWFADAWTACSAAIEYLRALDAARRLGG